MSHIDFLLSFLGLPSLAWLQSYGATSVVFVCLFVVFVMFTWRMLRK